MIKLFVLRKVRFGEIFKEIMREKKKIETSYAGNLILGTITDPRKTLKEIIYHNTTKASYILCYVMSYVCYTQS